MNYLLMICSDGVPSAEKAAAMEEHVPRWLEQMRDRGARAYGHALKDPSTAVTVRRRDGQTLLTDGPFAESKEFIAGFDIVSCADLDEAIEVAAAHPVSWFGAIEIRPFKLGEQEPPETSGHACFAPGLPDRLTSATRRPRHLMLMCLDGIPGTPEEEASIAPENESWLAELERRGVQVYGHAIGPAETATTVRVRDGETLLSDGPFVETKEFVGGFDIVEGVDREEAIEIAARHPLAGFHMVEVRPFAEDELGDE